MSKIKSKICEITNSISEKLISHRRVLHENAETGFDTVKTSKYIYDTLSAVGVKCSIIDGNGVCAEIYGKDGGKTILLRADIDALPIREETNLEFACKNGNMHACGHDMHAAMLLGAAEILQSIRDSFCGKIRLLFQPAEELLLGASRAIENGILDGVDMAMTLHVMTAGDLPTGSVILSYDTPSAPSCDFFSVRISGKGCHGSSPSIGIDPISTACRIITDLGHIKTHEIGIHEKAVLTVGEIHGGKSANVIPKDVVFKGTLRCFDEQTREFYKRRFEEISKGVASAFRCGCEIEYTSSCPCLINNGELLDKTHENLVSLLGVDAVITMKDTKSKVQGSEDFAYISRAVPSVSCAVCAGSISEGFIYPLHNPKVIFNEKALAVGCSVFAYNAIKLLQR